MKLANSSPSVGQIAANSSWSFGRTAQAGGCRSQMAWRALFSSQLERISRRLTKFWSLLKEIPYNRRPRSSNRLAALRLRSSDSTTCWLQFLWFLQRAEPANRSVRMRPKARHPASRASILCALMAPAMSQCHEVGSDLGKHTYDRVGNLKVPRTNPLVPTCRQHRRCILEHSGLSEGPGNVDARHELPLGRCIPGRWLEPGVPILDCLVELIFIDEPTHVYQEVEADPFGHKERLGVDQA